MYVSTVDFISSPAKYLEKVTEESIYITQDGQNIAVLSKPSETPLSDSLLGLLKGMDIESMEDIKKLRFGE
jgi:hypothetical protein